MQNWKPIGNFSCKLHQAGRKTETSSPATTKNVWRYYGGKRKKKLLKNKRGTKNRERLCPDLIAIVSNLISTFQIL
jgi:hypothetical protein